MSGEIKVGPIIVKGPVYIVMDELVDYPKNIQRVIKLLRIKNRMSRIDDEMAELEQEVSQMTSVVEGMETITDRLINMIDDTSVNDEQKLRDMKQALLSHRERLAAALAKGTAAAGEVTPPEPPVEPTQPQRG